MNRRIVVTGAAAGIGQATTELLRGSGDTVIGVDVNPADADVDVCADLATAEGRAAVVAEITDLVHRQGGGALDGIVTCAGLSQVGPAQVGVNFFGTTELVVGLQPVLATATAPRVALVGSISGTQPHDPGIVEACLADDEGAAWQAAEKAVADGRQHQIYASTKTALARWLRRTCSGPGWADAGIAMNAIAPGVVLTAMSEQLISDPTMKKVMDEAVPMPLGGYAPPAAIGHALLWLLAPENTHMTGQVIYVDGGAEATLRPDDRY